VAEPDDLIERISAELRTPIPLSDDQVNRIMASVRADGAMHRSTTSIVRRRRRATAWIWGSVATLGLAAGLLLMLPRTAMTPVRSAARPTAAGSTQPTVEFELSAATAQQVTVVGDFNHWDVRATPLRRPDHGGRWHAVVPLAPGRHVYAFVVDGVRWIPDPAAPRAVDDDFGSPNSVLTVFPSRGST
jgi:hypothetical protein